MLNVDRIKKLVVFVLVAPILSFVVDSTSFANGIVQCTISGKQQVIVDTNNDHQPNPGPNPDDDAYWLMDFDIENNVLRVYAEGGVGIYPQISGGYPEAFLYQYEASNNTLTEIASLGGVYDFNYYHPWFMLRIVGKNLGGVSAINGMDIFWVNDNNNQITEYPALSWKAGDQAMSAAMVDSDGDGIYDRFEGVIILNADASPWVPNLIIDEAIQYYPSAQDPQYVVIPGRARVYQISPFQLIGPFDIFIPIAGDRVSVRCGDAFVLEILGTTNGPGPLEPQAVPAMTPWGAIGLLVILLLAGVWFMRRTGFGSTLRR